MGRALPRNCFPVAPVTFTPITVFKTTTCDIEKRWPTTPAVWVRCTARLDGRLERHVALKILSTELVHNPSRRQRFELETPTGACAAVKCERDQ